MRGNGLAEQLRELGQLLRNLEDAAARVQVMELEPCAQAFAEWARAATTLLSEVAIERAPHERTKTDPLGFETMAELVEGRR